MATKSPSASGQPGHGQTSGVVRYSTGNCLHGVHSNYRKQCSHKHGDKSKKKHSCHAKKHSTGNSLIFFKLKKKIILKTHCRIKREDYWKFQLSKP